MYKKRILKAILNNGGNATTKEIMETTNLSWGSVSGGTKHLVSRALIIKRIERIPAKRRVPPHKIAHFKLYTKLMPKIERLISEIEG